MASDITMTGDSAIIGTSNVNSIGLESVSVLFSTLFGSLMVQQSASGSANLSTADLGNHSPGPPGTPGKTGKSEENAASFVELGTLIRTRTVGVVAGLAGASLKGAELENIFIGLGIQKDCVKVLSDIQILLELIPDESEPPVGTEPTAGMVVISGTGSVCMGKNPRAKKGEIVRVGGLGRLIGDEGSGYHIGIKAVKKALEHEYGWGAATTLLGRLKSHFSLLGSDQKLSQLIQPIHLGEVKPHEVAALSVVVFEEAGKGDAVSKCLVAEAAADLGIMISHGLRLLGTTSCWVYLVGGVFKQENPEKFFSLMFEGSPLKEIAPRERPIFINLSRVNGLVLAIKQTLRRQQRAASRKSELICHLLESLPVTPGADFHEYRTKYTASTMSTEQHHPLTATLSQTSNHPDTRLDGLKIMNRADESVLKGGDEFMSNYFEAVSSEVAKCLHDEGRVFLVGSGSSGRVAADLAARWKARHPGTNNQVVAIIAGGARAFLRAKEGCEDSADMGKQALAEHSPTPKDCVILISASGSAKFNLGAAHCGIHQKCRRIYYLHNSPVSPESELGGLFAKSEVTSLLVDIGAQTITGSTRLQAASFALLALGLLLNEASSVREGQAPNRASALLENLKNAFSMVEPALDNMVRLITCGIEVFSSEEANFHRLRDETDKGYLTYLAGPDCLREIMIDTAETSPTFSTNLPRSTLERGQKEAEFRAYMVAGEGTEGEDANAKAWRLLMGRELTQEERDETKDLVICTAASGYGSYAERPSGSGNLTILVVKNQEEGTFQLLSKGLERARVAQGKVAILAVIDTKSVLLEGLASKCDFAVVIEGVSDDPLGIVSSITLKKMLNFLSNGTMIGLHKVVGNIMVDVSPANNKLIDRSIRITSELLSRKRSDELAVSGCSYEDLYELVVGVFYLKKELLNQHQLAVPSTIRTVLEMIEKGVTVRQIHRS